MCPWTTDAPATTTVIMSPQALRVCKLAFASFTFDNCFTFANFLVLFHFIFVNKLSCTVWAREWLLVRVFVHVISEQILLSKYFVTTIKGTLKGLLSFYIRSMRGDHMFFQDGLRCNFFPAIFTKLTLMVFGVMLGFGFIVWKKNCNNCIWVLGWSSVCAYAQLGLLCGNIWYDTLCTRNLN